MIKKLIYIFFVCSTFLLAQYSSDKGTKVNSWSIGKILVTPESQGLTNANGIIDNHIALQKAAIIADSGTVSLSKGIYNLSNETLTISRTQAISFSEHAVLDSGTLIIKGGFEAPIKRVFGNNLTVNMDSARIDRVYPEWWGAEGNLTTDDYTALNSCFSSVTNKQIELIGKYKITSKLEIDCNNDSLTIIGMPGSKIYSTYQLNNQVYYAMWNDSIKVAGFIYPACGSVYHNGAGTHFRAIDTSLAYVQVDGVGKRITEYMLFERLDGSHLTNGSTGTLTLDEGDGKSGYTYEGTFNGDAYLPKATVVFRNAKRIKISGLEIHSDSVAFERLVGSYLGGLLIDSCDNVELDNVRVDTTSCTGISIMNSQNLRINDCISNYNNYMGLGLTNCQHGIISGGEYSYNGNIPFINGYGIEITGEGGTWQTNKDILITGVKANYNLRKGIGGHGGINIKIIGNFVKGFCNSGITLENSADQVWGEYGQLHYGVDNEIASNVIEQDTIWYSNLNLSIAIALYTYVYAHGIQLGVVGSPILGNLYNNEGGSWNVHDNILKNLNSKYEGYQWQNYGIHCWSTLAKNISIHNNQFFNCKIREAIIGLSSGNAGSIQISNGSIQWNQSSNDSCKYGIRVNAGHHITIGHNDFDSCTISDYGVSVFNYGDFADIKSLHLEKQSFPTDLDISKWYYIGETIDTSIYSWRGDLIHSYYHNGIYGGIGNATNGFNPDYAWDVEGNIQSRYDLIIGKPGQTEDNSQGRIYTFDKDNRNLMKLDPTWHSWINLQNNGNLVIGDSITQGIAKLYVKRSTNTGDLWVDSLMYFGRYYDVNLYRASSNVLKTDDTLKVAGLYVRDTLLKPYQMINLWKRSGTTLRPLNAGDKITIGSYITIDPTNGIISETANMNLWAGNGATSKNFEFGYGTGRGADIINFGGTTTAKQTFYANGDAYFAGAIASNSLTTGYIPYAYSTKYLVNSPIHTDGTFVGIGGTAVTNKQVAIYGVLQFTDPNIYFEWPTGTKVYYDHFYSAASDYYWNHWNGSSVVTTMYIVASTNRIGVNKTTGINEALDVYGYINADNGYKVNGTNISAIYAALAGATFTGTINTSGNIVLTASDNHIHNNAYDLVFLAGNGTTSKDFVFGYNTGYGKDIINFGGTTTAKQTFYANGNGYFAGDVNIGGAIKVSNSVGTLGQGIISDGTYGGVWGDVVLYLRGSGVPTSTPKNGTLYWDYDGEALYLRNVTWYKIFQN